MESNNSQRLTYLNVTEALLTDISSANIQWFPPSIAKLTFKKISKRVDAEGLQFITKTLPRFGKALDRALSGSQRLSVLGFKPISGTNLPKFLGEFSSRVFDNDGWIKPDPCIQSVKALRLILGLWYKLELPYENEQEEHAVSSFERTDGELPAPQHEHVEEPNRITATHSVCTESASGATGTTRPCLPPERSLHLKWASELPDLRRTDPHAKCGPGRPASGACPSGTVPDHQWSQCRFRLRDSNWCREQQPLGHFGLGNVNDGRLLLWSDQPSRGGRSASVNQFGALGRPHQGQAVPGKTDDADDQIAGPSSSSGTSAGSGSSKSCSPDSCGLVLTSEIAGLTFNLHLKTLIDTAARLLTRLLCNWDPKDVIPKHGPGAVSGGETQAEKRLLKRFIPQLHAEYPYDQYMFWSPSHLCDELQTLERLITVHEPTARICLVPKDSRGPRIISCENAENMRIQQGVMDSLVSYVERHHLTSGYVSFTDQSINGRLAAEGSKPYGMATLDLKDASDRLSLRLVQLVWPEHLTKVLEAVRSTHTLLPDGRRIKLRKHAPMGSSLCFPVMACTIWAVSTACLMNKYSRRNPKRFCGRVYVYGDDVITPEVDAIDVMAALEAVDLRVNRDKSYTTGLFKESCGEDWFAGHRVNGIKIRTPWSSRMNAGHYESWIDYSNQFYERGCLEVARYIAEELESIYGPIPRYSNGTRKGLPFPALVHELGRACDRTRLKRRWNKSLQTWEVYVLVSEPVTYKAPQVGWCDLLDLATRRSKPPAWQSPRMARVDNESMRAILGSDSLRDAGPVVKNVSQVSKNNGGPLMRSFAVHKRSKLRRAWRGDNGLA